MDPIERTPSARARHAEACSQLHSLPYRQTSQAKLLHSCALGWGIMGPGEGASLGILPPTPDLRLPSHLASVIKHNRRFRASQHHRDSTASIGLVGFHVALTLHASSRSQVQGNIPDCYQTSGSLRFSAFQRLHYAAIKFTSTRTLLKEPLDSATRAAFLFGPSFNHSVHRHSSCRDRYLGT